MDDVLDEVLNVKRIFGIIILVLWVLYHFKAIPIVRDSWCFLYFLIIISGCMIVTFYAQRLRPSDDRDLLEEPPENRRH